MKTTTYLSLFCILFFLSGCKPSPHPKNPNYAIIKPKVKYQASKKNLGKMVKQLQGSPYVWAEEGPNNFDCSGFTYYLYGSMGIDIPRVARHQAKVGKRISPKDLQYGDLIFFATNKRNSKKITHVGMYLGDGWFTHASTVKHEVIYSNLFTSPYYKKRLRVCRRYLPESTTQIASTTAPTWGATKTKETVPIKQTNQSATSKLKKAIIIKAPIKEIEQPNTSGHFYVQVGSFLGKPKSALIYQITRHGFNHKLIKFVKDGRQISKLLIGGYQSRSEAISILKLVRKNIQKDAFIAEIR